MEKRKNHKINIASDFPGVLNAGRHVIRSVKAKADAKRGASEKIADIITRLTGNLTFLMLNVIWFAAWLTINLNFWPGVPAFDPYPFGLLTTIVSLEAIILSIFVLISQNRQSRVDDLREEVDLEVDIITEEEVTKTLILLTRLMEKQGFDLSGDKELKSMIQATNIEKIEQSLEKQIIAD